MLNIKFFKIDYPLKGGTKLNQFGLPSKEDSGGCIFAKGKMRINGR
jgi:hypothetical protein